MLQQLCICTESNQSVTLPLVLPPLFRSAVVIVKQGRNQEIKLGLPYPHIYTHASQDTNTRQSSHAVSSFLLPAVVIVKLGRNQEIKLRVDAAAALYLQYL
jgi:hypothetical protein